MRRLIGHQSDIGPLRLGHESRFPAPNHVSTPDRKKQINRRPAVRAPIQPDRSSAAPLIDDRQPQASGRLVERLGVFRPGRAITDDPYLPMDSLLKRDNQRGRVSKRYQHTVWENKGALGFVGNSGDSKWAVIAVAGEQPDDLGGFRIGRH
jgi:hypothetical protein